MRSFATSTSQINQTYPGFVGDDIPGDRSDESARTLKQTNII